MYIHYSAVVDLKMGFLFGLFASVGARTEQREERRNVSRFDAARKKIGEVDSFGHPGRHQTPCFSDAAMKSSRSPSSTAWVLPTSWLVRRSLMRDWSST